MLPLCGRRPAPGVELAFCVRVGFGLWFRCRLGWLRGYVSEVSGAGGRRCWFDRPYSFPGGGLLLRSTGLSAAGASLLFMRRGVGAGRWVSIWLNGALVLLLSTAGGLRPG